MVYSKCYIYKMYIVISSKSINEIKIMKITLTLFNSCFLPFPYSSHPSLPRPPQVPLICFLILFYYLCFLDLNWCFSSSWPFVWDGWFCFPCCFPCFLQHIYLYVNEFFYVNFPKSCLISACMFMNVIIIFSN